ncbi:LysR substrate-binding domain-containing protein [Sulfitobacter faviae]|uniref:LysR substrate-binding domain-containing protein n=1 Tax=Sulfitobacter faviae TaxID=1775881 RepID=UPI00398D29BC
MLATAYLGHRPEVVSRAVLIEPGFLDAEGLSLTAAGRRLLPQALEAEAALLKGFNAVQGLDREAAGRIRLLADLMTAHYLLAPVLAEFAALHPEIEIKLRLAYTLDSIARNETDVSIPTPRRSRTMRWGASSFHCRSAWWRRGTTSTGCYLRQTARGAV